MDQAQAAQHHRRPPLQALIVDVAVSEARPAIPKELERQVLMEAGHRCGIPTCRHPTTEIAHIIPWVQVKEHKFENLIALCPNCHTRFDRGEIDRRAMHQYKANLSILTGRYADIEQRIFKFFADHPDRNSLWLPGGFGIIVANLMQDGLLEPHDKAVHSMLSSIPRFELYDLTASGREFVSRWVAARELE
jgi:hypothetical protein